MHAGNLSTDQTLVSLNGTLYELDDCMQCLGSVKAHANWVNIRFGDFGIAGLYIQTNAGQTPSLQA